MGGALMLYNLDPILSPDILYALRAMGHGDEILIADANYPAHSSSVNVIRLDGVSATNTLKAVLSVFPLDTYEDPVHTMQVVDNPEAVPHIVSEFDTIVQNAIRTHNVPPVKMCTIERFAFYKRASNSYCIIQTGETRLYGNILLKKGVIKPDG